MNSPHRKLPLETAGNTGRTYNIEQMGCQLTQQLVLP